MNSRVKTASLSATSVVLWIAAAVPATAQQAATVANTKVVAIAAKNAVSGQMIVVSLQDRELALLDNGVAKAVDRVAAGKPSTPSPTGTFTIINHVKDPTYYRPGVVIPPGRWNPVGNRWMGLSVRGYWIHGTDVQGSVGEAASHGCIRLRKQEIEALFAQVKVGTQVMILGQRNEETIALFGKPAAPQNVAAPATVLAAKQVQKASRPATVTETAEMAQSAKALGLERSHFYKKCQQLGISLHQVGKEVGNSQGVTGFVTRILLPGFRRRRSEFGRTCYRAERSGSGDSWLSGDFGDERNANVPGVGKYRSGG